MIKPYDEGVFAKDRYGDWLLIHFVRPRTISRTLCVPENINEFEKELAQLLVKYGAMHGNAQGDWYGEEYLMHLSVEE